MSENPCFQASFELVRNEPLDDERLEDLAEAVLDALNAKTRMVVFGPVVSVDFARTSLEVEFTVGGESVEDINRKIEHVTDVVRATLAEHDVEDPAFEYNGSRTDRLVAATA